MADAVKPYAEQALAVECGGERMVAVIAVPENPAPRGVLIVVGGPQYRAGSHRQFTLLARHLAARGIPAMRFDYRGMGDSEGDARTFEDVTADLRCAIDAFFARAPRLAEVALWGLCDAASAALFYAAQDARVTGIALANPWVRTDEGVARAHLKHYYAGRLVDPELWRKLARGEFSFRRAATGLMANVRQVLGGGGDAGRAAPGAASAAGAPRALPERMLDGLGRFRGKVLLILSGNDLTAREFNDTVGRSPRWRELLGAPGVVRRELARADHTFSTREWRDQVAAWTADWLRSW